MTDKQPEALRLAELLELAPEDGVEPQTTEDAAAELRRLHTENTALQQGYAAARLEIESLQARIKTMAEEHADELTVAHLDGRMRVAQAAIHGVQWQCGPQANGFTAPQADSVLEDAARYRWLRERMLGIDFDWNESGITALSFEMPDGCAYGGCCNQNIDAARKQGANHD